MAIRQRRHVLKKGPKRQRKKQVSVRTYCRRKARSTYRRAEDARRSMPF